MTGQVSDRVLVDGEPWSLTGTTGTGLFDPTLHGLRPMPLHTGCWRGYICTYEVTATDLRLRKLELGRLPGPDHDPLAGPFPTTAGGPTPFPAVLGVDPVDPDPPRGPATYEMDVVVDFTGKLLLGADFLREHYVHMGFQPAWRFSRVLEVEVDRGIVVARRDRSAEIAAQRDAIVGGAVPDPDGPRDGSAVARWIARTFRLGYDRSRLR